MSPPGGHETVDTPNLAELAVPAEAHIEDVLPPILVVLPRIPRAAVLIAQPVADPIPPVQTVIEEEVPEKDPKKIRLKKSYEPKSVRRQLSYRFRKLDLSAPSRQPTSRWTWS